MGKKYYITQKQLEECLVRIVEADGAPIQANVTPGEGRNEVTVQDLMDTKKTMRKNGVPSDAIDNTQFVVDGSDIVGECIAVFNKKELSEILNKGRKRYRK